MLYNLHIILIDILKRLLFSTPNEPLILLNTHKVLTLLKKTLNVVKTRSTFPIIKYIFKRIHSSHPRHLFDVNIRATTNQNYIKCMQHLQIAFSKHVLVYKITRLY